MQQGRHTVAVLGTTAGRLGICFLNRHVHIILQRQHTHPEVIDIATGLQRLQRGDDRCSQLLRHSLIVAVCATPELPANGSTEPNTQSEARPHINPADDLAEQSQLLSNRATLSQEAALLTHLYVHTCCRRCLAGELQLLGGNALRQQPPCPTIELLPLAGTWNMPRRHLVAKMT